MLPAKVKTGYRSIAEDLRRSIDVHGLAAGTALPSVRAIGDRYGVSRETARRALAVLGKQGVVQSIAKHRTRVLGDGRPQYGLPIAFVISDNTEAGLWQPLNRLLFASLQQAAAERGWSLLAVGLGGRGGAGLAQQFRECRTQGLVLDSIEPGHIDAAAAAADVGIPVVMMNAWESDLRIDAIVQDSFHGAFLATRHLLGRGHTRIGWLGPIGESVHSLERFGGYAAAMTAAGIRAEPVADTRSPDYRAAARALLTQAQRPTAVLALWQEAAAVLAAEALRLGLVPGRDLDLIGWTPEEDVRGGYTAMFPVGGPPPSMVWSLTAMARATLARLAERCRHPDLPPILHKIPVRLQLGEAS